MLRISFLEFGERGLDLEEYYGSAIGDEGAREGKVAVGIFEIYWGPRRTSAGTGVHGGRRWESGLTC